MSLATYYHSSATRLLTLFAVLMFLSSAVAQQTPPRAAPENSSVRSIDVSLADGVYVIKPLVRTNGYDRAIALENSRRIHAIMTSAEIGPHIKVFFPAGHYYFEGVVEDWLASIETTHPQQTFAGDGTECDPPASSRRRGYSDDQDQTFPWYDRKPQHILGRPWD